MDQITAALLFVVSYGTLALKLWAFYDITRFDSAQFKVVDKMPKGFWLFAMGAAIVLHFWLGGPTLDSASRLLTWVATVVVALLYLFDVRPKLNAARLAGA